jgi:hypothetical protein
MGALPDEALAALSGALTKLEARVGDFAQGIPLSADDADQADAAEAADTGEASHEGDSSSAAPMR